MATLGTGAAAAPERRRPDRLVAGQHRLDERAGKKGGEATGPNPTDRGQAGAKRHLVVEGHGIPLATLLSAATGNDSGLFEAGLEAIPPLRRPLGQPGRPRWRPAKVPADKGYAKPHGRRYCGRHPLGCRIARIGVESSERLGRYRWRVERTGAWYHRFRRLRIRDERRVDMHQAFVSLATALILLSFLSRL